MPVVNGPTRISEITDHLYLCGIYSLDILRIRLMGITHVINLTVDIPNTEAEDVTCDKISIHDSPHAKLNLYFDACADKIESVRNAGGKTLVHCMAGASRSVTICLAYLMKYHKKSLKDSYTLVKLRRPIARPNVGFFRQLIAYEKQLSGEATVSMVESALGFIPDVYLAQTKGMLWPYPIDSGAQNANTKCE